MAQNRIGQLISALFIVGTVAMYSSVAVDPIPSIVGDKVDSILAASSIESVFPSDGNAGTLLFVASSVLPAIFAIMYFLNIKYSNILFVVTFATYVVSPLLFNFDGADLYSSLDIFLENLLSALGGMLCLHIIVTSGVSTRLNEDIGNVRR